MVGLRNLTSAPAILKDIRSSLTWSSPTPVPLVSTNSSPPRYLVTCLENNKRIIVFLLQLCNLAPRTSPLAFGLHTSSQAKGVVLGTMLAIVGPGHSPPLKKIELHNQVSVGHMCIKYYGRSLETTMERTFIKVWTGIKLSFSTVPLPYDKLFNICVHLIFGKSQISTRSFMWANRLKVKLHTS